MQVVWRGGRFGAPGAVALALAGVLLLGAAVADAADPRVSARAALLMDARTGEVIWSKNPDQRRAPASTTKIVTTMLALESGRLDESFTVSSRAQAQIPSKLHLKKGQRVTLRDLTYSLMLKSANDGAVVVAEGLGGSVEKFAKTMEARARRAGTTRTSFRNPSGLPNSQHLSTARDLGKIVRAAIDVPGFRKVAGTKSRKIRIRDSKVRSTSLKNKNRLVQGYFASVIGKTGYTRAAGRCFAGAATYEGREVIVVVLGAKDLWGDTKKLLEWAHRGDGKNQWPSVQVASAPAPAPKPVAKPKPKAAPKPKSEVVAKAAPKAKPEVAARPAPKVAAHPAPRPAPPVVAKTRPPSASRSASVAPAVASAALAGKTRSGLPRSAALYPPPRAQSAALRTTTPRPRSAALTMAPARTGTRPPARVASLHSTDPPAYVRSYRPRGNVRRGCTGSGCDQSARYWPAR